MSTNQIDQVKIRWNLDNHVWGRQWHGTAPSGRKYMAIPEGQSRHPMAWYVYAVNGYVLVRIATCPTLRECREVAAAFEADAMTGGE